MWNIAIDRFIFSDEFKLLRSDYLNKKNRKYTFWLYDLMIYLEMI